MARRAILAIGLAIALAAMIMPVTAQTDNPEPVRVTIEGSDGAVLVGNYYAPADNDNPPAGGAPAVLLLHQMSSSKTAWGPLVRVLHPEGYAILAIDLRGHGETGGTRLWDLAQEDVQLWLDWLREQERVDPLRTSLVGASIGANLVLNGLAADDRVVTAVALSPGLDYSGVATAKAVDSLDRRPLFLLAGQGDRYSADSVRDLAGRANGDTLMRLYASGQHGTNLFGGTDVIESIRFWLAVQDVGNETAR